MRTERRWQVGLVCVVLMALLTPTAVAGILCGQDYEFIQDEPGPVDIACVTGSVYVMNGTANLVAGGEVTDLVSFAGSTINIYGGTILGGDYDLSFAAAAFVTVYAASAEVDLSTAINAEWLLITDSYIKNVGPSTVWFDLIGVYQDQTPFIIPCALETDAVLSLNIPQALPEIYVTPALLEWDLGDVAVGESTTQMVIIYNNGNADLNVSSVTISGSADFAVTGPVTPLVIAPNTSIGVDFEVTYAPTAGGPASATVTVVSDDEDESIIDVVFTGNGVVVDVPPSQQIQDILNYFDASVADGTLIGYGPGNSASERLNALHNMIESASDLIDAGDDAQAIDQLESIAKKTDGVSKPQDFVVGDATTVLNTMINDLLIDLTS